MIKLDSPFNKQSKFLLTLQRLGIAIGIGIDWDNLDSRIAFVKKWKIKQQ